jgi:hypothetical protein
MSNSFGGYSVTAHSSTPFPANPIPSPRTKLGKDALELYAYAETATERIQEARDAQVDAASRVEDAVVALRLEVERGGREGRNDDRERDLARELAAAKMLADQSVFAVRERAAFEASEAAKQAWRDFIAENLPALLAGEMEAEAVKVSKALIDAQEKLRPVELAFNEFHLRAQELIVTARGTGDEWRLAQVPAPPLPARHLWTDEPAPEAQAPQVIAAAVPEFDPSTVRTASTSPQPLATVSE